MNPSYGIRACKQPVCHRSDSHCRLFVDAAEFIRSGTRKCRHFLIHGHSPYESVLRHPRLQAVGLPSVGFALLIAFVDSIAYVGGKAKKKKGSNWYEEDYPGFGIAEAERAVGTDRSGF
ncbi:hypothetical protein [Parablautia sp. Marseille-Q6255]|uniref:hypothetical protein n=1 Tax=Parablautia sp. Marseille-Q6255 TaxID=3039593 RepID=UPI0024BC4B4E|nr:hypothetical protein [Parablautia sp. Marseille-Q6255]